MADRTILVVNSLSSHHGFGVTTQVLNQFLQGIHDSQSLSVEIGVVSQTSQGNLGEFLEFLLVSRVGSKIPDQIYN